MITHSGERAHIHQRKLELQKEIEKIEALEAQCPQIPGTDFNGLPDPDQTNLDLKSEFLMPNHQFEISQKNFTAEENTSELDSHDHFNSANECATLKLPFFPEDNHIKSEESNSNHSLENLVQQCMNLKQLTDINGNTQLIEDLIEIVFNKATSKDSEKFILALAKLEWDLKSCLQSIMNLLEISISFSVSLPKTIKILESLIFYSIWVDRMIENPHICAFLYD